MRSPLLSPAHTRTAQPALVDSKDSECSDPSFSCYLHFMIQCALRFYIVYICPSVLPSPAIYLSPLCRCFPPARRPSCHRCPACLRPMASLVRGGRGPVNHLIAAHDGAHAPVVRLGEARQRRPAAPKAAGLFRECFVLSDRALVKTDVVPLSTLTSSSAAICSPSAASRSFSRPLHVLFLSPESASRQAEWAARAIAAAGSRVRSSVMRFHEVRIR